VGDVTDFTLTSIGGPWARRLTPRRAWLDALPWDAPAPLDEAARAVGRRAWTLAAWSEYAAAASFAEIAAALCACAAPIELVAAAGDFIVDELLHAELAARIVAWLGGAVALEVELGKLVRPAAPGAPVVRAAELIVRACCVGEALTVPVLKATRRALGGAAGPIFEGLGRVIADEAGHAQLGWWFLDWAAPHLDEAARAHLGAVAGQALAAFGPLLGGAGAAGVACQAAPAVGALPCARYDPVFLAAATRWVARPLATRGIVVPAAALAAVGAGPEVAAA
jgi:hypothetical protein